MSLPTIVCLKSEYNNRYLRYDSVNPAHKIIFNTESPFDAAAHFEVVQAQGEAHAGMIHIKCMFNQKFLERARPENANWISATADKANENEKEKSCTLFKPTIINDFHRDAKKVTLEHVHLGDYACYSSSESILLLGKNSPEYSNTSIVFADYSTFITLPKNVAFKGDNGKYLRVYLSTPDQMVLQFGLDSVDRERTEHLVYDMGDGTVRFRSTAFGQFWRFGSDGIIMADCNALVDSPSFKAVFLDINVVALQCVQNNCFLKRVSGSLGDHLLQACASSTDDASTRFRVVKL